jgi:hypothetical protein
MVTHHYAREDGIPELFVFNTLVPQGHPGDIRRLELPSEYRWKIPTIHLGCNGLPETLNRDGPLLVDSSQTIFLIDSLSYQGPRTIFILRIQDLIEHVSSVRAEIRIPWHEWGRDAMTMGTQAGRSFEPVIIHGSRVLVLFSAAGRKNCLDVLDFGIRGIDALRFSGNNNKEISAVKERSYAPAKYHEIGMGTPESLGESVMFYIVSLALCPASGNPLN